MYTGGTHEQKRRFWKTNVLNRKRKVFEDQCSQDLLYRCLVAPRSLSAPLLRFLGVLFAKKANSIPTDAMLTRLLEPILWRHLKVVLVLSLADLMIFFVARFPMRWSG